MTQEPIEAVIARLRETRPHWSEAVQDDIYWASEIEADLSRLQRRCEALLRQVWRSYCRPFLPTYWRLY